MTPSESAGLARYIRAHFPQQPIDEYTSEALSELLEAYPLSDCRRAVLAIAERGEQWCPPSAVRLEVKRIRGSRLEDASPLSPPPGLDPDDTEAFQSWLRATRSAIADGRDPGAVEYVATRTLGSLHGVLKSLPPAEPVAIDTRRTAEHLARKEAARAELGPPAPMPGDEITTTDLTTEPATPEEASK